MQNGQFVINVTQNSTGQTTTTTINVNLNGVDPGSADLAQDSLVAQLNGVAGTCTASITPDGKLKIASNRSDYTVSFSDDTSGALAALGVNTFFTGTNAADIAVNSTVAQNPGLLAVGQNNIQGDNSNALAIANLQDQTLPALRRVEPERPVEQPRGGLRPAPGPSHPAGGRRTPPSSSNLQSQQQSVSGVNTDQEAINLLAYQNAYQGSARFLSVVDQMMQTLQAMS